MTHVPISSKLTKAMTHVPIRSKLTKAMEKDTIVLNQETQIMKKIGKVETIKIIRATKVKNILTFRRQKFEQQLIKIDMFANSNIRTLNPPVQALSNVK